MNQDKLPVDAFDDSNNLLMIELIKVISLLFLDFCEAFCSIQYLLGN